MALRHLLSSARTLLPLDHLCQVAIEQPRLLAFELRQDIPQRLTARVQRLGQPRPHLRPCACMADEGGIAQDTAEILPYEGGQDLRGGIACRAALAEGQPQRIRMAPAEGSMVAGRQRATTAREPTLATPDEAMESVLLGGIMAAGHGPIAVQAVRGRCAGLVADEGWHRHGHPCFRGGWLLTLARAHRL